MHSDLVELGWTEDQWGRICATVADEAQKVRVAAQVLPVVGPEDASTIAVPKFQTTSEAYSPGPGQRLTVDSNPDLYLTRISVNIYLRSHEVADPTLSAALQMFRRAANYIARVEDTLVFYGRGTSGLVAKSSLKIPEVYELTRDGKIVDGVFSIAGPPKSVGSTGDSVFNGIVEAIDDLDASGYPGPYACILGRKLFELICTPNGNLVLPRDRILPFVQGPLVRSSAVKEGDGAVIALSGNPIELVVASDIKVSYLQTSLEPRWVFRVSERVALRIKEPGAVTALKLS